MKLKKLAAITAFATFALSQTPAHAVPVDYVQICDAFGAAWLYLPGTETCYNPTSGEIRFIEGDAELAGLASRLFGLAIMVEQAFEGVAISLAIPDPIIQQGHHFAIAGNWSQYGGYHALGFAGAIAISDHLAVNAGIGIGLQYRTIGTRLGLTLTW